MCVVLQIAEIPVKSERWDAAAATAFVELQLPTVTVNVNGGLGGLPTYTLRYWVFRPAGTALPLFPQRWVLS